MIQAIDVKDF